MVNKPNLEYRAMLKRNIPLIIIAIFIALGAGFYFAVLEGRMKWGMLNFNELRWNYCLIAFGIAMLLLNLVCSKDRSIQAFLFKYRFVLALCVFVLAVIFQIHGSSIGVWTSFFGGKANQIGVSRPLRSDEWAVFTPMTLSQYMDPSGAFPYFSETIRGTLTDVFIVYGLPVLDVAMVFRLFQIGYLFLNEGSGLAFYWSGRLIALFLVSFEFGRLITEDDRRLSFIYACLIAFAPVVEWWFSINAIVEMFVSGQLMIIVMQKYFDSHEKLWEKILWPSIFFVGAGTFAFTLYPAWQIPLAYVFLALFIWNLIKNKDKLRFSESDVICMALPAILCVLIALHVFKMSWGTIQTVMSTSYPGKRFEKGGGDFSYILNYPMTLFIPIINTGLNFNASETAVFFDFFPLGLLLLIYNSFKRKKNDFLSVMLFIPFIILFLRCLVPWPAFLSKISLLSMSQTQRIYLAVGFLNILILIRSLYVYDALVESDEPKKNKLLVMAIATAAVIALCWLVNKKYMDPAKIIMAGAVVGAGYLGILFYRQHWGKNVLAIVVLIVAFMGGVFVNPICQGVDFIQNQKMYQAIEKYNDTGTLWMAEGIGSLRLNYPIMAGASTINTTNVYPDNERWKLIDPDGESERIYNRYAHVNIVLQNKGKTYFKMLQLDAFEVHLNVDDLKKLEVTRIWTTDQLEEFSDSSVRFDKLYDEDGYRIYSVKYLK